MNRIYRQVEPTYTLEQDEIIPVEHLLSSAAGVLSIRMNRARSLLLGQLICPTPLFEWVSLTFSTIGLPAQLYNYIDRLSDSSWYLYGVFTRLVEIRRDWSRIEQQYHLMFLVSSEVQQKDFLFAPLSQTVFRMSFSSGTRSDAFHEIRLVQ